MAKQTPTGKVDIVNYQAYSIALIEQVDLHANQLDQLSKKSSTLTQIEKTAVEPGLQIIVEHLLSSLGFAFGGILLTTADVFQHIQPVNHLFGIGIVR